MPEITDPALRAELLRDELDLLLEDDVANALGVTTQTLATWRCEQKGPGYVKSGKQVFYSRALLREYIQSCIVRTTRTDLPTHESTQDEPRHHSVRR